MPSDRLERDGAERADLLAVELAEAIHRARNDLSAIIAMLRLHAAAATDPAARLALDQARDRVIAIVRVNARLDASAKGVETLTTTSTPRPSSPAWWRIGRMPCGGGRSRWRPSSGRRSACLSPTRGRSG